MTATQSSPRHPFSTTNHGRCYVDGKWRDNDSEAVVEVFDPATEEPLSSVRFSSTRQVEDAVLAAKRALSGPWEGWSPRERSDLLHRLCDELERRAETFHEILLLETGSPLFLAKGGQFASAVGTFRWFAEAARRGPANGYEHGLPLHHEPITSASLLRQEPVGVVSAITAYNYPLLLLARKLGGVLASGCTSVVMPSERAPLTTVAFFELLEELDLPPGVANLVLGGVDAGTVLSSHPAVDMVSFTGSAAIGAKIMAQAAPTTKKLVLEQGGKSPTIILPGADIPSLIGPATQRYTIATGQGCGCATRVLVPQQMKEEFVEATAAEYNRLPVGDPRAEGTFMGPLIREDQRGSVEGYVDRALRSGGEILAGGGRPEQPRGYFVNPALVGGVSNDSEIAQNELFGPVSVLLEYTSVDEAIELANATTFGLYAVVWGRTNEAMQVARGLRSGNVAVNGGGGFRFDMPWGGPGLSGVGREAGEAGFSEFFETKHIQWPL